MNAPVKRVLPTPVARAKQSEGNSRSKSATVGNSLRVAANAASRSASFFSGTISVMRARISSERRCGGRRLRRPAIALTWRFMKTSVFSFLDEFPLSGRPPIGAPPTTLPIRYAARSEFLDSCLMTAAKISDTMRRKSDPGDRKAFHHAVRDEFSFHNEERVCKLRIRSHCERSEAI